MANPYAQPIDNLSAFTHPTYRQQFRYMNDKEGVALAHALLGKFVESGYQRIVVIESGTSPLIQIIRRLPEFQLSNLEFLQLKIPRDQNFNLYEWFMIYLSPGERDELIELADKTGTRADLLRVACDEFDLASFVGDETYDVHASIKDERAYDLTLVQHLHDILRGTHLSTVLTQPFLLFDEYINSGTVLRIANAMFRLVVDAPQFKVSAFCMFIDDSSKYPKVAFSLYDKRSELACYERGAYPYENRVDLIGYYYVVQPDRFQKVELATYANQLDAGSESPEQFYERVSVAVKSHQLTDALRRNLVEPQVSAYVTDNDVARHVLRQLELAYGGATIYSDLLDQVFEIYAPAWSPMPVHNHLDYWNGFAAIADNERAVVEELAADYAQYRTSVLHDIVQRLLANNAEWNARIETIVKEEQS